jgi:hypothetical protein
VVQVVEHLSGKSEALRSSPGLQKKKKITSIPEAPLTPCQPLSSVTTSRMTTRVTLNIRDVMCLGFELYVHDVLLQESTAFA